MIAKVCTLSRAELTAEIRLRMWTKEGEFDIPLETLLADLRRRKESDEYWNKSQRPAPPRNREEWGWIG